MTIFKFFVGASIITNSALICFRSQILGTRDLLSKTWIFNASQYVLFGLMLGVEMIIPDVPKDVKTQLKRLDGFQNRCLRYIIGVKPSWISRLSNAHVMA